ncbi:MAG: hypothetical protein IOC80_11390 [Rhodobacter sp.]|nr:hypothetical protein [Rhodobacter sp.]MCA3511947.1 hypothetical protein [Rhodobacter sp.]MCA3520480.1 hypothetical protein [Rhodobacter sp.]MCA3526949.1 hypothetical protein [Rhodobacter sp.]MCA3527796.1 hypothetical protein [Rhodobacter sp.]
MNTAQTLADSLARAAIMALAGRGDGRLPAGPGGAAGASATPVRDSVLAAMRARRAGWRGPVLPVARLRSAGTGALHLADQRH